MKLLILTNLLTMLYCGCITYPELREADISTPLIGTWEIEEREGFKDTLSFNMPVELRSVECVLENGFMYDMTNKYKLELNTYLIVVEENDCSKLRIIFKWSWLEDKNEEIKKVTEE